VFGDVKGDLHTWAFQTSAKPQPLNINLRSKIMSLTPLSLTNISTHSSNAPDACGGVENSSSALTPRVQLLAAACADGLVSLVDVDAARVVYCFSAHRGVIQAVSGGDAVTTPPALLATGCVLLATASGEDASVKVIVFFFFRSVLVGSFLFLESCLNECRVFAHSAEPYMKHCTYHKQDEAVASHGTPSKRCRCIAVYACPGMAAGHRRPLAVLRAHRVHQRCGSVRWWWRARGHGRPPQPSISWRPQQPMAGCLRIALELGTAAGISSCDCNWWW
jgi:hypothetical protein